MATFSLGVVGTSYHKPPRYLWFQEVVSICAAPWGVLMEQGKKAKVLCLHGFRTSGNFLKKQISKWHPSIFQQFDMVMPRTQRI